MIVPIKDNGAGKTVVLFKNLPLLDFVNYVESATGKHLKWIRRGNAK